MNGFMLWFCRGASCWPLLVFLHLLSHLLYEVGVWCVTIPPHGANVYYPQDSAVQLSFKKTPKISEFSQTAILKLTKGGAEELLIAPSQIYIFFYPPPRSQMIEKKKSPFFHVSVYSLFYFFFGFHFYTWIIKYLVGELDLCMCGKNITQHQKTMKTDLMLIQNSFQYRQKYIPVMPVKRTNLTSVVINGKNKQDLMDNKEF